MTEEEENAMNEEMADQHAYENLGTVHFMDKGFINRFTEDVKLHRFVFMNKRKLKNLTKMKPGQKFYDMAFTSTSRDREKLYELFKPNGWLGYSHPMKRLIQEGDAAELEILVPKGTGFVDLDNPIFRRSFNKEKKGNLFAFKWIDDETEILLQRGAEFEFVKRTGNKYIVKLSGFRNVPEIDIDEYNKWMDWNYNMGSS